MRFTVGAAIGGLLAACVIDSPSFDETFGSGPMTGTTAPSTSTTATSGASTSASTGATAETSTSTSTTAGSSGGSTTTADASTTGSSGGSTTISDETVYPVSSCVELQDYLKNNADVVASGIYTITLPQQPDTPVTVYCDLETEGGGWLLVGRSHPTGASGSFGWRSSFGSVADDSKPYSLGLHVHPFNFDELLIGDYSAGKAWGGNVYNLGVPSDFVSAHQNDTIQPSFFSVVKGACQPNAPTWMLRYAGYTAKTSAFFFRDDEFADMADYGLLHDKLWTFYTEDEWPAEHCSLGGALADKQGMIMVR